MTVQEQLRKTLGLIQFERSADLDQYGVINYIRDNTMVLTLNGDELPEWIDARLPGVDVMFDEMTYREMEFALKEVMKAESSIRCIVSFQYKRSMDFKDKNAT